MRAFAITATVMETFILSNFRVTEVIRPRFGSANLHRRFVREFENISDILCAPFLPAEKICSTEILRPKSLGFLVRRTKQGLMPCEEEKPKSTEKAGFSAGSDGYCYPGRIA